MRGAGKWLAAGLLAVAAPCQAQGMPSFLKIDGRYYGVGPSDLEYYADVRALVIIDTTALNCRRENGGTVTPFGFSIYYSQAISELQINSIQIDINPPVVVEVTTVNGDVVCLGEVAPPVLTDPNLVFSTGFE